VYVCTYPPRVHKKRRDTSGEREGGKEKSERERERIGR